MGYKIMDNSDFVAVKNFRFRYKMETNLTALLVPKIEILKKFKKETKFSTDSTLIRGKLSFFKRAENFYFLRKMIEFQKSLEKQKL